MPYRPPFAQNLPKSPLDPVQAALRQILTSPPDDRAGWATALRSAAHDLSLLGEDIGSEPPLPTLLEMFGPVASVLTEAESRVISLIYGFGCSPLEANAASAKLGISQERVRQLRERAVQKLQSAVTPAFRAEMDKALSLDHPGPDSEVEVVLGTAHLGLGDLFVPLGITGQIASGKSEVAREIVCQLIRSTEGAAQRVGGLFIGDEQNYTAALRYEMTRAGRDDAPVVLKPGPREVLAMMVGTDEECSTLHEQFTTLRRSLLSIWPEGADFKNDRSIVTHQIAIAHTLLRRMRPQVSVSLKDACDGLRELASVGERTESGSFARFVEKRAGCLDDFYRPFSIEDTPSDNGVFECIAAGELWHARRSIPEFLFRLAVGSHAVCDLLRMDTDAASSEEGRGADVTTVTAALLGNMVVLDISGFPSSLRDAVASLATAALAREADASGNQADATIYVRDNCSFSGALPGDVENLGFFARTREHRVVAIFVAQTVAGLGGLAPTSNGVRLLDAIGNHLFLLNGDSATADYAELVAGRSTRFSCFHTPDKSAGLPRLSKERFFQLRPLQGDKCEAFLVNRHTGENVRTIVKLDAARRRALRR